MSASSCLWSHGRILLSMRDGWTDTKPSRNSPPARWRKRLLVAAACFLVVNLLPLGFVLDPSPNKLITHSNSRRIDIGMHRTAVEAIIGRPGNHCSPPFAASPLAPSQTPPKYWLGGQNARGSLLRKAKSSTWNGDRGRINVYYDDNDVAVAIDFWYPTKKYKWLSWVLYDTGEWQF